MSVVEMDNTITRAIKYLHSGLPDSQYYLGLLLDEAIKTSSYDVIPELSEMFNLPPVYHEYPNAPYYEPVLESPSKKDSKLCSNSELELDLLKEDLACIVCKGMDVGAKNQLLECCKCHALYHQECHTPPVAQEDLDTSLWTCSNCKSLKDSLDGNENTNLSSNSSSGYFEVSEITSKDVQDSTTISDIQSEHISKKSFLSSDSSSDDDDNSIYYG